MTDQTSPAAALPVVGYLNSFGNALCKGVPRFSTDIALTPQAPAQATINVLRAEVERLKADAARYCWLRNFATPGQRPPKNEMPMGYREIRLRVDTPVYMPAHWAKDVDRLIDAEMHRENLHRLTDIALPGEDGAGSQEKAE